MRKQTQPAAQSEQPIRWEPNLRLSDRLVMRVLPLPNFTKGVDERSNPLDRWLCF